MKENQFIQKITTLSHQNRTNFLAFLNELPSSVYIVDLQSYKILYKNDMAEKDIRLNLHEKVILQKCEKNYKSSIEKDYIICHDSDFNYAYSIEYYPSQFDDKNCVIILFHDAHKLYQHLKNDLNTLENEHQELIDRESNLKNQNMDQLKLLSNLSHEIRTPLYSIKGYIELLSQTNLNHEQKEYLDKSMTASNHLLHMVNHIMDYAKLESGKMIVEKKPFKLSDLISDVKSVTYDYLKSKNIYFDVNFQASDDIFIGDSNKIKQIMINLISNAIKFTNEGGITLVVILEKSSNEHQTDLLIEVKDTGIGMTKEQINVIFNPFTQGNQSTSRIYGGTGLGLTISKKLVLLLQGSISVDSKLNVGSIFKFRIPLEKSKDEQTKKYLEKSIQISPPRKNATILVAEDNQLSLKLTERLLINMGMKVITAKDGFEVLECVEKETFDLILMDIKMPKLDGIETTKKLRSLKIDIPIIALTANTFLEDRVIAFKSGMNDYITKPLDSKSLYEALSHWIPEK